MIVSFGEINGACRWFNENQIENSFEMITDSERKLYKLFGMKKSYSKVWSISCLVYYAEQLNFKRQLPKAYEDVDDDPHQMGGNLILQVDKSNENSYSFKSLYVYKSATPPDRPKPSDMLNFIRNFND